jgi:hypothetical protein
MSRKKLFIFIAIVLVLIVAFLVWYYFFVLPSQNQTGNSATTSKTFTPFGGTAGSGATGGFSSTTATGEATTNQPNYTQKLRELWNQPTSGAGVLDTKAGTVVRFVDKATGFVYETQLFSPIQNRLANTTIPLAYNAVWDGLNNSFVAQYLKDDNTINTNVLTLKGGTSTSTDQTLSGFALGSNISSVSVFGETIFYLQTYVGQSFGFTSTFDGKTKKQIWQSPLDELTSQMVNANYVALTTKPYQNVPGFTYLVNTGTGSVKKLLGDVPGLVSLVSPDASQVLYSSQNYANSMALYNVKTGGATAITPATFPEKCVWSKKDATIVYCAVPENSLDGTSLTAWYMGQISWSDDIWKYDLKQNTAGIIEHLADDAGEQIDVIKPILSTSEQYLIFTNKIDGTLWSLDLSVPVPTLPSR